MGTFAAIWYSSISGAAAQRVFQTVSALSRNPVAIDVHGDRDRAVTELALHVTGRLVSRQEQARVRVPQVMGVANF